MDVFNGAWTLTEVPDEFFTILKILGFSGLERKYLKKNKLKFNSLLEENVLTIKFASTFYNTVKDYPLNGKPTEYVDDRKNNILEVSHWVNEKTINIKTMYLEKGLTILNTKTLKNEDQECHHEIKLVSVDHPEITANLIYYRIES